MRKHREAAGVDWAASTKKGLLSGFRILWELAKVIVPAVTVIHVLDKTGFLLLLGEWLGPVMGIFGLPGESALVLVTANFVSFYGGLAMIVALALPFKQTTILTAMMMICHGAISETALVAKVGARGSWVLASRILAMIAVGLLLHMVLP